MKITYTTSEAIRELATAIKQDQYFGTDVTVEIVPDAVPASTTKVHPLEAYANMIHTFGGVRHFSKKIDAIKFLRSQFPIGLADAKYVVEATTDAVLSYYSEKKTLDGFAIHKGL